MQSACTVKDFSKNRTGGAKSLLLPERLRLNCKCERRRRRHKPWGHSLFFIFDRRRRENVLRVTCSILEFKNDAGGITIANRKNSKVAWENRMPLYVVRHLGGDFEELSCFQQLEDESAAMYFNIIHGAKVRRRFTTERAGDKCTDYLSRKKPESVAAKKEKLLYLTRRNVPASRSSIKLPRHEPARFEAMSVLLRNEVAIGGTIP